MHILYYDWDEFNGSDARDAMKRLGHEVDVIKSGRDRFKCTEDVELRFRQEVTRAKELQEKYDAVFSFNYFPFISDLCNYYGIRYVSWVFDSPHYPLYSVNILNPCNRVYVFDKRIAKEHAENGITTIGYSPLGVNENRLKKFCDALDAETDGRIVYQHDVSFVGSLYDNEFNFYDQIQGLPPELRLYWDDLIIRQERVYGKDLFSEKSQTDGKMLDELMHYVEFENSGSYNLDYRRVLLDFLRKKVTINERKNILRELGSRFDTVMYTNPDAPWIDGVPNLGIADYNERMPRVFRRSKININITMRSILSGIPLRVMDVLAAGGFLLTSYTPEIEEYFTDGVDLAIARTPEEMIEKTAYYLEHEDERKEIAVNGQRKVFERFSYTGLLPGILG